MTTGQKPMPPKARQDSDFESRERDHDRALKSRGDLRDWARAWEIWINDVAQEFREWLETHPNDKDGFKQVKTACNSLGDEMFKKGKAVTDLLRTLESQSSDPGGPARIRGVLTDATNPPPPPFGKGH